MGRETDTPVVVSKWAARESYFFNQGSNIAFWSLYFALNVGMAVWAVWEFAAVSMKKHVQRQSQGM